MRQQVSLVGRLSPLIVAACFAAATPAAADPFQVPPIETPATGEHHPGKPVFMELITPDLAASKAFYAGLFGWTFRDVPGGRTAYTQADLDGETVAGMLERPIGPGERRQPAWLSFFAVADVDATTQTAVQDGARALVPAHDLAGRGREAVLADPQGAVFAVLASSSGDPPDEITPMGGWIWHALIAADPTADAAFYRALWGASVVPIPSPADEQHLLLVGENFARASVNSLPVARPNARPTWLGFVRVTDVSATIARVSALGGQILVEPRADRHGGRIAVIADPIGAPFGVMEWSEPAAGEGTP